MCDDNNDGDGGSDGSDIIIYMISNIINNNIITIYIFLSTKLPTLPTHP